MISKGRFSIAQLFIVLPSHIRKTHKAHYSRQNLCLCYVSSFNGELSRFIKSIQQSTVLLASPSGFAIASAITPEILFFSLLATLENLQVTIESEPLGTKLHELCNCGLSDGEYCEPQSFAIRFSRGRKQYLPLHNPTVKVMKL